MQKKTIIFVCLLLVACMLLVSAVVVAPKPPDKPGGGKPGEGPEATGTIFFEYNDGVDKDMWIMNADGSGKLELDVDYGLDGSYKRFGDISRIKHNNHYWFVRSCTIDGEYYPDGLPRREIFAIRDDNTMGVQLTNDPSYATNVNEYPVFGINDNYLLLAAKRWIEGEQIPVDFGIYRAEIAYDVNENIVGLIWPPTCIWNTGYWYNENQDRYLPDMKGGFDVSPDESKIVLQKRDNQGMFVVDLDTGSQSFLTGGYDPRWSPDGNKIAFTSGGVRIINPDGTEEQIVVENRNNKHWTFWVKYQEWSPDSNFLVYYRYDSTTDLTNYKSDIYHIRIDGSDNTCITKDLPDDKYKAPIGWR